MARDPFHDFATDATWQSPVASITIAADASLDEGAVLRATFRPTLGSVGTEYFLGLDPNEASVLLDAVVMAWEGCPDDDTTATLDAVRTRLARIVAYTNPPAPRTLVVAYDVTGWTDAQIASIEGEATVQGESSDDHPDTRVDSTLVDRPIGDVLSSDVR